MTWSFACGTWFRTRLRISWLLPLLFVVLCINLKDFSLGIAVGIVFLISTLLHEFGHIFAVRKTGGNGDEILLWPLGGLAAVAPGPSFRSRLLTPAAGPLVNLTLCLIVLIPVLETRYSTAVFYPFEIPVVSLGTAMVPEILAIVFWVNWLLL
ncbi:MAG: hypothetical protein IID45_16035, partial [Planctomycetes bacterium]|nr:hypothetical protein [Planctomycetota bacterium]